jgi:hypothetical protein
MRSSWQPLAWYLGIAVLVPILNGASPGEHAITTVVVAASVFAIWRVGARFWRRAT